MAEKPYLATVEKIFNNGPHGPYAVARCKALASITFSLESETWKEDEWPEPGESVILDKMRMQRGGWRAKEARFVKP